MNQATARELLESLIQEIGREEFAVILKSAILWGVVGALLGLVTGFGIYRGFRRLRWYAAASTAGQWVQRGAFAVSTLACIVLFGAAGAWEGVRRQCQPVVERSRLGTEALPFVANQVADGLGWLDFALERGLDDEAAHDAHLTAFRAGTRELNAPAFLERVAVFRREGFQVLLARLEEYLLKENPVLKGGFTEQLLHQTIESLGPALLDQTLSRQMDRRGITPLQVALRDRLVAEAARRGDPATIGHQDLSAFILREGIVPAVVAPVRKFARQQQILYVAVALLCCFVPPPVFRVFRKTPPAPPPGPAIG